MATYAFTCSWHGEFEGRGEMQNPPRFQRCPQCSRWAQRRFTAPQFTEDRIRLYRNPVDGTRHSYTLGAEMPDSKREYYRQLAALGAEPVSHQNMPQAWKENLEYKRHLASGGQRDERFEHERHPSGKKKTLTVSEQLKSSGVKIG